MPFDQKVMRHVKILQATISLSLTYRLHTLATNSKSTHPQLAEVLDHVDMPLRIIEASGVPLAQKLVRHVTELPGHDAVVLKRQTDRHHLTKKRVGISKVQN